MEINLKLKVSGLYSSRFCCYVFTDFPKNGGSGGIGSLGTEKSRKFFKYTNRGAKN